MSGSFHASAQPSSIAVPAGNGAAAWFGSDDYPAEALRSSSEGLVRAIIAVSPEGRPASCTVVRSSGSASLDGRTCAVAMARGAFRPARDAHGRALTGSFPLSVRWALPVEAREPRPAAASTDAGATGEDQDEGPWHRWGGRLVEAEHLLEALALASTLVTAGARHWLFGDAALDGFIGVRDAMPRRRWRRWQRSTRLVRVFAPVVLVAVLLAYLGR